MKSTNTLLISLALGLLLLSCSDSNRTTSTENTTNDVSMMPMALQEGLEAHGGLYNWKKYGALSFVVSSRKAPEKHLVDLMSRKVLITTDTSFTMGYNGKDVWVSPNLAAYSGSSPRFYHNLLFYFFALPFVITDPGAQQEALPDITFNGVPYNRVRVTFGEKVGDSPDDQYILWFRTSDHMLQMINYSVTFFDAANASKFNAIVYEEWERVNELQLPKQWTSYRWENDSLGERRGTTTINQITLKEQNPDGAVFEMPEKAEIDTGKN